jgi:hypothetical protein
LSKKSWIVAANTPLSDKISRAYAIRFEQTVEPEAVIARFVARNHIHAFIQFSSNTHPNPLAELQELLPIAGLQRVDRSARPKQKGAAVGMNAVMCSQ